MATITAQDFNRNPSAAKRAAEDGPLVITDRGRKRFVLLTYEEFERLEEGKPRRTLLDLAHPDSAHIDLEFERDHRVGRDVDLS
jgi:prevent-host-death family protein